MRHTIHRMALLAASVSVLALGASHAARAQATNPAESVPTTSPIKHVIVIIGENATFDHVFGTYLPRPGQTVRNLRFNRIVGDGGRPAENFSSAQQFTVSPQPSYFVDAPDAAKTPYAFLPPPDLGGVPQQASDTPKAGFGPPPFATTAAAGLAEPFLLPADVALLTTGASGLTTSHGPDTRITNDTKLANGPFQFTARTRGRDRTGLAYDSYTEDTYHRFYQMWQQSDCAIRHATARNPSGCLSDLYPFVITTFEGATEGGQATSMGFFNMNAGDAPYLKQLADTFTLADNYHQAVMGGTGANHIMMQTGDLYYYSDGKGTPLTPPSFPAAVLGLPSNFPPVSPIANPNPVPGTNNQYINDPSASLGVYTNCSDPTQPGVAAVLNYLSSLPYHVNPNCAANTYYLINNFFPGYHPNGTLANPFQAHPAADGSDLFFVPPQTVPTIGDALNASNIPWAFYGDGLSHELAGDPFAAAYCPICDAMQYTTSTFATADQRAAHLKDSLTLLSDISNNTVPSVVFLKPSGFVDGHPLSSKLDLFEAFVRSIVTAVQANPQLYKETAILVTWDEGGGFYDSGFIQPVDFFGDGPRTPFLVISPFTQGGIVGHDYYDHVSILKFIERNFQLHPLSSRSRDNLPNPIHSRRDAYTPTNMPAIGDLWGLFQFPAQ